MWVRVGRKLGLFGEKKKCPRLYTNEKVRRAYNVTLRRALAIISAITITYSECVSSLSHPACNAHAPYCHVACLA